MKSSIALLLAFVILAQCLTAEQKAKWRQILNDCKSKTGIDESIMKKHRSGVFLEDQKMKENYFCVLKNLGILDDNGEFQHERISFRLKNNYNLDVPQIEDFIRKCAIKYEKPENTAFEYVKCFYANKPKHN